MPSDMAAPDAKLPPAAELPPRVHAFLDAPRVATIATAGPDGEPHQAATWYRLEGHSSPRWSWTRVIRRTNDTRGWLRNIAIVRGSASS